MKSLWRVGRILIRNQQQNSLLNSHQYLRDLKLKVELLFQLSFCLEISRNPTPKPDQIAGMQTIHGIDSTSRVNSESIRKNVSYKYEGQQHTTQDIINEND